jgi:hypothetical protein
MRFVRRGDSGVVGTGASMAGLPRLISLKQAAAELGPEVSVKVLRREVHAGRLRCYRLRPGSNSKILVSEEDLVSWLEGVAGRRRLAPSPGRRL